MGKLLIINKILSFFLKMFHRRIYDAYQFVRILQRMNVPFDMVFSGDGISRISVAENLILQEDKAKGILTAWITFKSSNGFSTSAELSASGESLTFDRVIAFCEQYHKRKEAFENA